MEHIFTRLTLYIPVFNAACPGMEHRGERIIFESLPQYAEDPEGINESMDGYLCGDSGGTYCYISAYKLARSSLPYIICDHLVIFVRFCFTFEPVVMVVNVVCT